MSDDLIELAMRADRLRAELFPDRIVTYCVDKEQPATGNDMRPLWRAGMTGVEYLKLIAQTRLEAGLANVEVDWRGTGMKIAQLALRFGANDFGYVEGWEEEVRRIIHDAGFVPKRRDSAYSSIAVD